MWKIIFSFNHNWSLKETLLKIDKVETRFNKKVVIFTITLDNSHPEKTLINTTSYSVTEKTIVQMIAMVTISLPEDSTDKEFHRILFKSSFDVCKIEKIQSTFVIKALMENFASSANFNNRFEGRYS